MCQTGAAVMGLWPDHGKGQGHAEAHTLVEPESVPWHAKRPDKPAWVYAHPPARHAGEGRLCAGRGWNDSQECLCAPVMHIMQRCEGAPSSGRRGAACAELSREG